MLVAETEEEEETGMEEDVGGGAEEEGVESFSQLRRAWQRLTREHASLVCCDEPNLVRVTRGSKFLYFTPADSRVWFVGDHTYTFHSTNGSQEEPDQLDVSFWTTNDAAINSSSSEEEEEEEEEEKEEDKEEKEEEEEEDLKMLQYVSSNQKRVFDEPKLGDVDRRKHSEPPRKKRRSSD